jgi:small ligand-binding sensory domain FIST
MSFPARFRHAHARGDWSACAEACAEQLGTPGRGLGFVYLTDALAAQAEAIVQTLRERTGVENWVGSSASGVVATGVEYVDEPALVAMVADFGADSFRVFSGRSRAPLLDERTADGALAANFAVVHADPHTADLGELVAEMSTRLVSGYLVGGITSAGTHGVQIANDVLTGGISGAVLASDVMLRTRLSQGCSPLGARFTITECEDNVIATLDGLPALEVFKQAAGELLARDLRRAAAMVQVGLPVRGTDTGDYLVRNLVGIDPKNGLIAIGERVQKGDPLLFCLRDAATARTDLERMLGEISSGEQPRPRGALYYSCVARGEHLFGRRGAELELLREALGDVPLVGFFCNGEISHDRLYAYTGVLTLFD